MVAQQATEITLLRATIAKRAANAIVPVGKQPETVLEALKSVDGFQTWPPGVAEIVCEYSSLYQYIEWPAASPAHCASARLYRPAVVSPGTSASIGASVMHGIEAWMSKWHQDEMRKEKERTRVARRDRNRHRVPAPDISALGCRTYSFSDVIIDGVSYPILRMDALSYEPGREHDIFCALQTGPVCHMFLALSQS
jgi:hypothetical protein